MPKPIEQLCSGVWLSTKCHGVVLLFATEMNLRMIPGNETNQIYTVSDSVYVTFYC